MYLGCHQKFDTRNPLLARLEPATRHSSFIIVVRGRYKGGIGWCHHVNFLGFAEVDLLNHEDARADLTLPLKFLRELPAFTFRKLARELCAAELTVPPQPGMMLEIYEPASTYSPNDLPPYNSSHNVRLLKPELGTKNQSLAPLGDVEDWVRPRSILEWFSFISLRRLYRHRGDLHH